MSKNYFYSAILFVLFSFSAIAQEGKPSNNDALGFYPNPVTNGKIYITSKSAAEKEIIIFDVLGKKVLQSTTSSKEINISNIPAGVYIIKIKEEESTVTRKLIVR
jgi:hypothetical protein